MNAMLISTTSIVVTYKCSQETAPCDESMTSSSENNWDCKELGIFKY